MAAAASNDKTAAPIESRSTGAEVRPRQSSVECAGLRRGNVATRASSGAHNEASPANGRSASHSTPVT